MVGWLELFQSLSLITVKDLLHSIEINYFGGDNNIIATFTINTKY